MISSSLLVGVGAVAAWMLWPIATGSLFHRGRLHARWATLLVIARTPVVAGAAILLNGGPLWIVGVVVLTTGLAGWLLAPYLQEFMADVERDRAASRDIHQR